MYMRGYYLNGARASLVVDIVWVLICVVALLRLELRWEFIVAFAVLGVYGLSQTVRAAIIYRRCRTEKSHR